MMRRLFLTTLGFCMALSAEAAYNTHTRNTVVVPDRAPGFEYGITGAYLRADYPQVDYVLQGNTNDPETTYATGRYQDSEADYDWGWGFMVGWRVGHNTGLDARLHYFSFCSDDETTICGNDLRRTHGVDDGDVFWSVAAATMLSDGDVLQHATRYDEYKLSAFDLELAQSLNVGRRATVRFIAGVAHHDVERLTRIGYRGERPIPNLNVADMIQVTDQLAENVSAQSEFAGWGPRIGADLNFTLYNHFGLVGHIGSSLLFGTVKVKTAASRRLDVPTICCVSGTELEDNGLGMAMAVRTRTRHLVVPNVDLRLGVDYTHQYESGTLLTGELGIWGRGYFGGMSKITLDDQKHLTQFDNVVFHGLYFSIFAQL